MVSEATLPPEFRRERGRRKPSAVPGRAGTVASASTAKHAPGASTLSVQEHETLANEFKRCGLDASLLEPLEKLVDVLVARRLAGVAQKKGTPVPTSASVMRLDNLIPHAEAQLLSAAEFGRRLNVSDETIRLREKNGELFSVLPSGRLRGRRYPAIQLMDGLAGEPLRQILGHLQPIGGAAIYQFLTSRTDDLGGFAPVEVLLNDPASQRGALARMSATDRLRAVLMAATAFVAETNG